jgi:hypothetical protein
LLRDGAGAGVRVRGRCGLRRGCGGRGALCQAGQAGVAEEA